MLKTKWAKYIYNIPEDLHYEIRSEKCAVSLKTLTGKYGKEEGTKRFNDYCEKQRYTNSFEYKQQKQGWTKRQYDEYNKSRAVTLKTFKIDGVLKKVLIDFTNIV